MAQTMFLKCLLDVATILISTSHKNVPSSLHFVVNDSPIFLKLDETSIDKEMVNDGDGSILGPSINSDGDVLPSNLAPSTPVIPPANLGS